jgi:hypothetical protein
MKLADHCNDFFATRQSVAAALEYATEVCSALPDQAAMIRTVLHVVLNSAIAMHKDEISRIVQRHAELDKERTDPLTEQIRNIVREMTKGELLGDTIATIVKAEVDAVIGDKTQECIEEWVSGNLDSKIEEWSEQNLDLSDAVKTYIDDEIDFDDMISEKIHSYFNNNSFNISVN